MVKAAAGLLQPNGGAHAFGGPAAISYAGYENSDIEGEKIKADAPPAQLYDLEADLKQTTNLYRSHPQVVKEMQMILEQDLTKQNP